MHLDDRSATTPRGQITTGKIIPVVIGHIEGFGRFTGRLMHVFTYACMMRALFDRKARSLGRAPVWGVTPANPTGTTVCKANGIDGTRTVIRNGFTLDPRNHRRIASVGRDHDRGFAARFPMIKDVGMQCRWGERPRLGRNNLSAFGEVADNRYSVYLQPKASGIGTPLLPNSLAKTILRNCPPPHSMGRCHCSYAVG